MVTVFLQTKIVHAETARRGEVVDAEAQWRWLARPQARHRGWHSGLVEINGRAYRAECTFVESEGHHWQVIDLRSDVGSHHRLTFGPDGEKCSCEHFTYRNGCICKHIASMACALMEQEEWERNQWGDSLRRETELRRAIVVPF